MPDRDQQILEHIGRYTISIRPVISGVFFSGRNPGNVLQRLIDQGRIVAHSRKVGRSLPGGFTHYQLSLAQARELHFPSHRARPMGVSALQRHLATLWFCCMESPKRALLESEHLGRLFETVPTGNHVLERRPDQPPSVLRVFVTGPKSSDAYWIKALQTALDQAQEHAHLRTWMENRRYLFAVLTSQDSRRKSLQKALDVAQLRSQARILVRVMPRLETLKDFLNGAAQQPK